MKATTVLLAAGLTLAAAPAPADDIDYAKSRIGFRFKQMNVPVEGGFKKFRAQLRFDDKRPEAARAEIEVDLASIDTGSPEGDVEAQRKSWFDTAAHPTAKFVSSSVKRVAPDRFEISGQLTLKSRTHALTVPVEVTRSATERQFAGSFVLKRLEFAIGEGVWADTETVADAVEVRFRIVQRSVRP